MRSTRTLPRHSGRKVKNWSESRFSSLAESNVDVYELMNKVRRNAMIEPIHLAGSFTLPGASMTVNRMGYGAMQLAGPEVWGPPRDVDAAIAVLREAVESGVNHIDTSDYYGPHVTNQLIKKALHPYPDGLVIVTKVGARRGPDKSWLHALSRSRHVFVDHDWTINFST